MADPVPTAILPAPPASSAGTRLTPAQRQQETVLFRAILLDFGIYVALILAAVLSGSLTLLAELPRTTLLFAVEIIAWITMRRSHRGRLSAYEYGVGKIERVTMILIAGGLLVAAIFTVDTTIRSLDHPNVLPTPALILAVVVASMNFVLNTYFTGEFIRSNSTEESLILESQIRSRMVKTAASGVVLAVLITAIWLADPIAVTYVDALGAVFVAAYMAITAIQMLRESVPDVLDRALPESDQLSILRVITQYFDDFEHFGEIRSRRSGGHSFIDIRLMFDPERPLKEVVRRCEAIERDLRTTFDDAVITIVPGLSLPTESVDSHGETVHH